MMHLAKAFGRNAIMVTVCSVVALIVSQIAGWVADRSSWPLALVGTCVLLTIGATAWDRWRERKESDEDDRQPAPQLPSGTAVLFVYQRPWWPTVVLAFVGAISFGFALGSKSSPTIINYVPGAPESGGAGGEQSE